MHRKFIALILATAMAITGLSAAPARADGDTARVFAGLAFLALLGAAIQKERKHNRPVVSHNYTPPVHPLPPRPLPPKISRRDLPQQCLRSRSVNGRYRNLVGNRCLKKNYGFNGTLPYACQLGYRENGRNHIGYEPVCLRERGYRFARR